MIGRLRGTLIEKQAPSLLVDVNGVCYEVQVPMTSFYDLPALEDQVVLHTHFVVNETAQQLFGFVQKRDRELFRTLIRVNGVGPKMALAILSGMEVNAIVRCVQDNDPKTLVSVPGVGKKTAERLIIELRDRLQDWDAPAPTNSAQADEVLATGDGSADKNILTSEAESALIALGYKPTQASQMVLRVLKSHSVESPEELIRLALKSMVPTN